MSEKVIEFKKKLLEKKPANYSYVLICLEEDGDDGYLQHSEGLDGFQVIGILEWAKTLKLREGEGEIEILQND